MEKVLILSFINCIWLVCHCCGCTFNFPTIKRKKLHSLGSYFGNFTYRGRVRTVRQLREGSPANPWEVAWVVWNYVDPNHFYYLAIKAWRERECGRHFRRATRIQKLSIFLTASANCSWSVGLV